MMSLKFSNDVLDNAILVYELKSDEALDKVVYACLRELKELRGRLTCSDFNNGYQQGKADAFKEIAYSDGVIKEPFEELAYQQGRADALDHCEKCEADQWDALYKAEMKGRADAIEELKSKADCKNSDCYNCAMADGDMNCMLGLL